ncbi:MAG: Holliday junction branch migration protein RuvA [Coprobacillus sp.]|nr:Holliday junction branch migration protein RuvA [Coprobacillus sp.]
MIYYLKGKIAAKEKDQVVIDVAGVGYEVYVSHLDQYTIGEDTTIYTYEVIHEDEDYLIGFSSLEEKNVFLSLIKVKGLGPKMVINALSTTTPELVMSAIAANNVAYLKNLPGIGQKAASQIILDLKGEITGSKGDPGVYDEVKDALKSLGYKGAAIDRVLSTINIPNGTTEEIIKEALKELAVKKK